MKHATNPWMRACAGCDRPMAEACADSGQPRPMGRGWMCGGCFRETLAWFGQRAAARLADLAAIAPAQRSAEESAELVRMLARRERRRLYQRDWHQRDRAAARRRNASIPPRKGPGRITWLEVDDVLAKVG